MENKFLLFVTGYVLISFMPLIQAIILGLVQGLAEFIPISSSGHLVAVSQLLGWEAPAVAFDTILHLGTLLAVLIYFWREWRRLLVVGGRLLAGVFFPSQREKINRPDAKLLGLLIMGTVPALVVGYLFRDQFEKLFESLWFVTLFFFITAILLAAVELFLRRRNARCADRPVWDKPSWGGASFIGVLQALAILPGLSRSGLTIGGGIFSGLTREGAARFSFLLSAPVILAAGALGIFELQKSSMTNSDLLALLVGFVVAALSGWLAIHWLLKFLRNRKLYVFSLYLIFFGLIIIWLAGF